MREPMEFESLAHLSRWRRLVIACLMLASPAAFSQPQPDSMVLYRCKDADGVTLYTSNPAAGCVVVSVYGMAPAALPRPRLAAGHYTCTSDCSGHRAGYEWARNRGIAEAYQCSGNSQSFINGCIAFTEGHPGF